MINTDIDPGIYRAIYDSFSSPITNLDCGKRCGPYNQKGVPFCCDYTHSIPTAYEEEWQYLRNETDLWRIWIDKSEHQDHPLVQQLQPGHQMIVCRGFIYCQREYRSIACRAFPFFPYLNSESDFFGLTYYPEYRDRCWVISHLDRVDKTYLEEFFRAFERLFKLYPDSVVEYQQFSKWVRNISAKKQDSITVLTREREALYIDGQTESIAPVDLADLPAFDPYDIIRQMPFPKNGK